MRVWIDERIDFGIKHYIVLVDGTPYDSFTIRKGPKLRRDDLRDIAAGYKEALEGYNA